MSSPRQPRAPRSRLCTKRRRDTGRALSWRDRAFRSRETRRDGWRSGGLEAMERPSARKRARERWRASRRTLGREADVAEASVLLKGAHSAPTMTTLRRSPLARTTTEARSREAGARGFGAPARVPRRNERGARTTPRCRRGRGRERGPRGVRGAVSDVSEPLEPPRVSSRTRKIKTAVDGLGAPLRAPSRTDAQSSRHSTDPKPSRGGTDEKCFCLRPSRVETPSRRDASSRTFDPRALARALAGARRSVQVRRARLRRRAPPPLAPFPRTRPDASSDRRDRPSAFSARGVDRRASLRASPPPLTDARPRLPSTSRASTASPRSPLGLPRVPRLQLALADVDSPAGSHPGVSVAFRESTNPNKLNLGVGAYRTEDPQPYVLDVVKQAERRMLEADYDKEYLPMQGLAVQSGHREALLGDDSDAFADERAAPCVARARPPRGRGVHRRSCPARRHLPSPTWATTRTSATPAPSGTSTRTTTPRRSVWTSRACSRPSRAPPRAASVLHGCAHNPTGVDPTMEEWEKIATRWLEIARPVFRRRVPGLRPAGRRGGRRERPTVREEGLEFFCAQSYSKNLGLYAERVGAINVLADCEKARRRSRR